MKSDDFLKSVKPFSKDHGFSKNKTTWRKELGESMAVFNVQKSQWDSDGYYLNVGVYYHAIGNEKSPTEYRCHVRARLELASPEVIVENAMSWFDTWGSFENAIKLAKKDPKGHLIVRELQN